VVREDVPHQIFGQGSVAGQEVGETDAVRSVSVVVIREHPASTTSAAISPTIVPVPSSWERDAELPSQRCGRSRIEPIVTACGHLHARGLSRVHYAT
jgi:hypothetical protein